MEGLIYCILVLFVPLMEGKGLTGNLANAEYLSNVGCAPHVQITGTDDKTHQYLPYYVKLYRCQGADLTHAPTHRTCEPTEIKEVEVIVNQYGHNKVITLKNHTQCEYKCKQKTCNKYQKWNEDTCSCDCASDKKSTCQSPKFWGGESCCKCPHNAEVKCQNLGREMDADTCQCKEKKIKRSKGSCAGNNLDMQSVVVVVILEFILVVILCTVTFYCCCRKRFQENSPLSKNLKCHQHQCSNDQLLAMSKDSLVDNV